MAMGVNVFIESAALIGGAFHNPLLFFSDGFSTKNICGNMHSKSEMSGVSKLACFSIIILI